VGEGRGGGAVVGDLVVVALGQLGGCCGRAGEELEEGGEALGVEARPLGQLPEDRAELVAECEHS
jgi:hypothetical protein